MNDERIDAPRTLEAGDVVRVGKTVLQVTDSSGVVPEKSRPPTRGAPGRGPPSVSAEAGEVLVVTAGGALGRRLDLKDELVIGRGVDRRGEAERRLELSRRHARLARDASGQLTVEDLGSANGTFVNGERVQGRQVLGVGDSVEVGSTTLQLTDVGRAPARPAIAEPLRPCRPARRARRSPARRPPRAPRPARGPPRPARCCGEEARRPARPRRGP